MLNSKSINITGNIAVCEVRFHLGGLKMPLWSLEDAFEAPQCYPGAQIGSHMAPKTTVAVAGEKSQSVCKTMLPAAEVLK